MKNILLIYILIPILVLGFLYCAYRILHYIAKYQAELLLEKERQKLKEKEMEFQQLQLNKINEITTKQAEALAAYKKGIEAIQAAEKIRADSQAHINQLFRENKQLQEELHSSRQRAIRLAKRHQTAL